LAVLGGYWPKKWGVAGVETKKNMHVLVLVESVARVNNSTVVVVAAPGAVLMPWVDAVPAVLIVFLTGQEYGSGVAGVLFGAVSPSARLPITPPNHKNEVGFSEGKYPA
jgi:hypothetical protein